jgi:hypothetical protein
MSPIPQTMQCPVIEATPRLQESGEAYRVPGGGQEEIGDETPAGRYIPPPGFVYQPAD